jgi:sugar phosphate isomerase/epimerase
MAELSSGQLGFAASSGPVERYFPLARRHGLSWLEFSCQNPVNFPQTFDRARIRRVRALVERSGIRCGVHSASFVNTAEIMPTVRKAAEQHLREYVDLTAALGCEYLVVHCGFHFSVYLDRVRAALYETMARCVDHAGRRGIPVVIENMNRLPGDSEFQYLGVTVEEYRDLFRRIRSPYLGLGLDVAHCELLPGGTLPFVRAFGDRIHSVQLSDNRGRVDEHMAIGEGTIDFRRVLGALRRMDFTGPLIIELFDVPKKLLSLRRLRALLAGGGRRSPVRRGRRRAEAKAGARSTGRGVRREGPAD